MSLSKQCTMQPHLLQTSLQKTPSARQPVLMAAPNFVDAQMRRQLPMLRRVHRDSALLLMEVSSWVRTAVASKPPQLTWRLRRLPAGGSYPATPTKCLWKALNICMPKSQDVLLLHIVDPPATPHQFLTGRYAGSPSIQQEAPNKWHLTFLVAYMSETTCDEFH